MLLVFEIQTLKRSTSPKKRASFVRESFRVNPLPFRVNRLAFCVNREAFRVNRLVFREKWAALYIYIRISILINKQFQFFFRHFFFSQQTILYMCFTTDIVQKYRSVHVIDTV